MMNQSSASGPSSWSSSAGKPDRLFVGNLSPTVDEYTLIQVFSKYGKITKLDYMFHKSGVLKGKPRGYAFVEFSNKDDALKAMVKLHDRLLRGRKLVVTYANSAPVSDLPLPTKGRRLTEPPKTTTLSLLKSHRRPQSAAGQIAAMEAKLASMAKKKPSDEDYVPGSSTYPLGQTGSGSASPVPAPYSEVDHEPVLGVEEGEKAAEDLRRELEADLARGKSEEALEQSGLQVDAIKVEDEQETGLAPKPSIDSDVPPPRPMSIAEVSGRDEKEEKKDQRHETWKKGLAGLPKKPVF